MNLEESLEKFFFSFANLSVLVPSWQKIIQKDTKARSFVPGIIISDQDSGNT